jgi:hypothetical protein
MAIDNGFEWNILKDSETGPGWRYVDQLEDRLKSIKRMFVYVAAQELLTNLKDKIPKTAEYRDLRDSLVLSEIPGGDEPSFSVHASLKSRKVKKVDQQKTVLYVRVKRGLLNPAPERIKFLEDNGPWTTDTIPFWPSKKWAVVVQRLVSKREADHIARMQRSQSGKISALMQKLSIKKLQKDKAATASQRLRMNKAVPDTSFVAIQLEYGGEGHRPIPAWRVGVGDVMRSGIKTAPRKYRELKKALSDPDSTQWKRWPKVKDKVKVGVARGFTPFMKKLGFI